jgi:hypothetical protein
MPARSSDEIVISDGQVASFTGAQIRSTTANG